MFPAALKGPSLIIYTTAFNVYARHFSFLNPQMRNHLCPNFASWHFEMEWLQHHSVFPKRSVFHFSAFVLETIFIIPEFLQGG